MYIIKPDCYKINTDYNVYYPIGNTCKQFHLIRYNYKEDTLKKIKHGEIIDKLQSYLVPAEMSFFYRVEMNYNHKIFMLMEFFNGEFIKRLTKKCVWKRCRYDNASVNLDADYYICHLNKSPFPTKYLSKPKYINMRYQYFQDNMYKFFYTIDLIQEPFNYYTVDQLKEWEQYLKDNNFNLNNFRYVISSNDFDKYKSLEIEKFIIHHYINKHKMSILECPCEMCSVYKNEDYCKIILNEIERISKIN